MSQDLVVHIIAGERWLVVVEGEVDLATAPSLTSGLASLDGVLDVDLDLAAVTFMDSSGLHALFAAARDGRRELRLIAASPQVQRLLDMSGIAGMVLGGNAPAGGRT